MGIENTKLLACESVYWVNINDDIEKHINNCTTCLTFQQTQPKSRIIHQDILAKPWEVIGADMFTLNNKHYLCIIDYHSKLPIIKKTEDLSEDSLILSSKVIFAEYRPPNKIMSDSYGNFISDKFKMLRKSLNIEQVFSSSYHYWSNGQVEACIRFVKHTLKKCFDTKGDPHIALLQTQMNPLGPGLPSPATILFNHPIRGLMSIISRLPVGINNYEEHYAALVNRQMKDGKNQGTPRNYVSIPTGSTAAVQCEGGGLWIHGTVEGKGDHNHHERSYNIHIKKTG